MKIKKDISKEKIEKSSELQCMFHRTNIRENTFYFELNKVHVLNLPEMIEAFYGNRCSLLILKCCYTIKRFPPKNCQPYRHPLAFMTNNGCVNLSSYLYGHVFSNEMQYS